MRDRVSFTEVEDVILEVQKIRSLMLAMGVCIFSDGEDVEYYSLGYDKIVDEVLNVEKRLQKIMNKMTGESQVA